MTLSSTSKLVLAFVTLIIGVVLAAQVATVGVGVTQKLGQTDDQISSNVAGAWDGTNINESYVYTVTNNPTSWKVTDCPLTNVVLTNSSGTEYTDTTDYVFTASAGTFTLKNTATVNATLTSDNLTYVDYTYCGDDYMNLTWGRTGINLVPGFFALALLLISVGLFYSVARENGILG